MSNNSLPRSLFGLAVAVLLLTLAGAAATVPKAIAQTGSGATPAVTIQAREYEFSAPDAINSGLVDFSFQNVGTENHFAQFFKLNSDVSPDDVSAALASGGAPATLPLITTAGGGNVIQPGASQQFTLELQPGRYVLLCFVHDEDDPTPHALKGMFHPFAVVSPSEDAAPPLSTPAPPVADLAVSAAEFAFNVPAITAGSQTVQFVNAGTQPHEMTLLKVTDDPQAADSGGADVAFHTDYAGGLAAVTPGATGWATVNFTPGVWMFICYVPDASSGAPHATLGMVQYVTVN